MKTHTIKTSEKGVVFVEMALVAPVFFLLLFGIFEIGIALWNYNTLAYITREGARFAAVNSVDPQVENKTKQHIITSSNGLTINPSDITISWSPDRNRGSIVTVEVQTNYLPITGYLSGFKMSSTTNMTVSR